MALEIAVCDEARAVREQIDRLIRQQNAGAVVTLYETGEELLASGKRYDMVFLDIQMAGRNGLETAAALRRQWDDITLIFVTGLKEYVFDAFDVGAFHYLLKPVSEEKFAEVFVRAAEKTAGKRRQASFLIRSRNRNIIIPKSRILYVESRMRKAEIHTCRETYEIYATMNALGKELGGDFYRCHRSYLVNLGHVAEFTADSIILTDGTAVFLSREKYNAFEKRYVQYLQNGGMTYVKA